MLPTLVLEISVNVEIRMLSRYDLWSSPSYSHITDIQEMIFTKQIYFFSSFIFK